MNRCEKCCAVISDGREHYVKGYAFHEDCAPEHTAEMNFRNIELLNERVSRLEELLDQLEKALQKG